MIFGTKLDDKEYIEREGSYGLVFREDEVAVVKVRNSHFLIGGGIETGENKIESLKREFIEEIGFTIKNINFINQFTEYHHAKRSNLFYKTLANVYKVDLDMKVTNETEQNHALTWLKVDDLTDEMALLYQGHVIKTAFESLALKK